jgi:hypothetical protein
LETHIAHSSVDVTARQKLAEIERMRQTTKFRVTSNPSRKYLELEKYFPSGSKGQIVEH